MTVGGWLNARRPAPPPALSARIRAALGHSLEADASGASEACLGAGERLAGALLRSDSTTRESALDLLAADALVTYAFEAASERPEHIVDQAVAAIGRMAALASVGSTGAVR